MVAAVKCEQYLEIFYGFVCCPDVSLSLIDSPQAETEKLRWRNAELLLRCSISCQSVLGLLFINQLPINIKVDFSYQIENWNEAKSTICSQCCNDNKYQSKMKSHPVGHEFRQCIRLLRANTSLHARPSLFQTESTEDFQEWHTVMQNINSQAQDYCQKVVSFIKSLTIFLLGCSNYQLYTNKNLRFLKDCETSRWVIVADQNSFAGMELLLRGNAVQSSQFQEIYGVVTVESFQESRITQKMTYDFKIRSLARLLLELISQEQIEFKELPSGFIEKKQCLERFHQMRKRFKQLILNKKLKANLDRLKKYSSNYLKFLQQVLIHQTKLTWKDVIQLLIPQQNPGQKSIQWHEFIPFQDIMTEFVLKRSRLGDQSHKKLKELGLIGQAKPLFVALLEADSAFDAICCANLNCWFYPCFSKEKTVSKPCWTQVQRFWAELLTDPRVFLPQLKKDQQNESSDALAKFVDPQQIRKQQKQVLPDQRKRYNQTTMLSFNQSVKCHFQNTMPQIPIPQARLYDLRKFSKAFK